MGNSFISAYLQSDWFGKGIFWGLFALSIICWTVLIHKSWIFFRVRRLSEAFASQLNEKDPLALQFSKPIISKLVPHPFFEIYKAMKSYIIRLHNRNAAYGVSAPLILTEADFSMIEGQALMAIASSTKTLEKNLFLLSTVVTLAPFLGLLGTVWGILVTFSQLQIKGLAGSNSAMLSGLALALATTVIGLVVAIPALVGYNYLKNICREYRRDMEDFAGLLLTSFDLVYRKPDYAEKTTLTQ